MSRPLPLQNQFRGMARDFPRSRMPQGYLWDVLNMLPNQGAPLRRRGAFEIHSEETTAATASGDFVQSGVFAVFSPTAGPNRVNVVIDENLNLYTCSTSGDLTRVGAVVTLPEQNPVFMGGVAASAATAIYTGLVIVPQGSNNVPKKFDGTTISDLGGSPPKALFAGVYKDYLVLGNGVVGSTNFPNRVWFSLPGDPDCAVSSTTAWDTTDSWIDFNDSVFGFGSTPNALIVFHRTGISRVRGSVAPPEDDMIVDHMWQRTNLIDPLSIVESEGYVYWVSNDGVFRTDGVTVEDLTAKGAMTRYWADLINGPIKPSSWSTCAGILRNHLFIQIIRPSFSDEVDGFIINLKDYSWVRMSNSRAQTMWMGEISQADELFFGSAWNDGGGIIEDTRLVQTMSGVFQNFWDSDGADDDPDGSQLEYVVETPFYELGRPGIKRMKRLFVGYEIASATASTAAKELTVSYILDPGERTATDDYTSMGTLTETSSNDSDDRSDYERRTLDVHRRGSGVGFRFVMSLFQEADPGDFSIHDLSLEVEYQEESKRA